MELLLQPVSYKQSYCLIDNRYLSLISGVVGLTCAQKPETSAVKNMLIYSSSKLDKVRGIPRIIRYKNQHTKER